MARYKDYSYAQTMMIPVSFEKQILPGTFEYTLCHLIDNQIDMSVFKNYYENDTVQLIPDNQFRGKQVAFQDAGKYKKRVANWKPEKGKHYFLLEDFYMDTTTNQRKCRMEKGVIPWPI